MRGVRSDLIGRKAELEQMNTAFNATVDFQAPQLISVVGNQGTGKTRLVDELVSTIGQRARVYSASAVEGGAPREVITRLLRDRFAIPDSGATPKHIELFKAEVERVLGDDGTSEVLHFLGGFLGFKLPNSPFLRLLDENPVQHDEIARTVLRRFLEADAHATPLVLILDDLQWAGDDAMALLRELGNRIGGSSIVLIACARSELSVRLADWGGDDNEHTRINLRNLEPDDAESMFRNLLSRCESLPIEIVDDAVEMTGGNPYFIEQLVRLFHANGTIDDSGDVWKIDPDRAVQTELPISIEEAIEARIADLEADERDVLEKGAVFGNVFWTGAIVSLLRIESAEANEPDEAIDPMALQWSVEREAIKGRVDEIIAALVDRDYLLRLDPEDSAIARDCELVFKHNLERVLITKSTEPGRQQRYYRRAAQWLETKLTGRSDEQLEFLAQLYDRGGDHRRAAYCYLAAADKARGRFANDQAIDLYQHGLDKLGFDDAVARLDAMHNLGDVLVRVGKHKRAARTFEEMLRYSWMFESLGKGGAAHNRLGRLARALGDYTRAMEHLRHSQDLFSRAEDLPGVASCLDDIGRVHWLRGAYRQALEFHRKSLSIRRGIGDQRSIALSLANIGRVHHDSGGFKAAISQYREALDIRRDIGDLPGVVESLLDLADVHREDRQYQVALDMLSEAKGIADETGDMLAQIETVSRIGEVKCSMGRGVEAVEDVLQAISLASSLGNRVALTSAYRRLAEIWLNLGDFAQAKEYAKRALDLGSQVGSRPDVATANRVLGEIVAVSSSQPEDMEEAEGYFRKAIEILATMKNELQLARCYRSFSALRERMGAAEDAATLTQRADEIFGRLRGAAAID